MPLVTIDVIKHAFSPAQNRQIIENAADAMARVEGEAPRGVTWVGIQDVEQGGWAIGGKMLGAAGVHALAAGKS